MPFHNTKICSVHNYNRPASQASQGFPEYIPSNALPIPQLSEMQMHKKHHSIWKGLGAVSALMQDDEGKWFARQGTGLLYRSPTAAMALSRAFNPTR